MKWWTPRNKLEKIRNSESRSIAASIKNSPVIGNKANVESKQDEKLLILKKLVVNTILRPTEGVIDIFCFLLLDLIHIIDPNLLSYAVVHPGTMMIHLFDAPWWWNWDVMNSRRGNSTYNIPKYFPHIFFVLSHLWQTEQWWALSGLILQHFGHLKITWTFEDCVALIVTLRSTRIYPDARGKKV